MITVADVVTYASKLLNDQETGNEFMVWEESFLEQAASEAIALIAGVYESAFVKTTTMSLSSGVAHAIPEEMRNSFRVTAQVCGSTKRYNLDRVDAASIRDSMPSPTMPCGECVPRPMFGCAQSVSPCGDWDLRKWAWSTDQADTLFTYPPVQTTGMVEVSYTGNTVTDGVTPLHERWLPAIVSFTLFRAYSVDNESQIHVARAASNFDTFVSMTGINNTGGVKSPKKGSGGA